MTNYYSKTSFLIDGWPQEAIDWMVGFAEMVDGNIDGDFNRDAIPESWGRLLERFGMRLYDRIGAVFERQEYGNLWVQSEESVSTDALVDLIHAAMVEFDIPGIVVFEWAEMASSPTPGAFGGGAAVISAHGFNVLYPERWLEEATHKLMAGATDAHDA